MNEILDKLDELTLRIMKLSAKIDALLAKEGV